MAAVCILEVDFIILGSTSLKQKRSVVRSIKDRVRSKFNVSIAEVGHHDLHARCVLGIVSISNERSDAEKRLRTISALIDSYPGVRVVLSEFQWV